MKYGSIGCVVAIAFLGVGCFNGTDNVPHSSGGGGAAASGGHGANGGAAANGGAGPGGSGSHATSSGSGANGGAGTGGAPDPCANSFFCDDFESYPAGSPPAGKWTNNQNGGSVAVDTAHAHSGTKAVKTSADASTGYRSVMIKLTDASLLPPAGNVLYGRMMFFLESAPTGTVHWTFIDGMGKVPGQSYDAIYRYGGQLPITDSGGAFVGSQLMANYDTPDSYGSPPVGPSSDCWLHADKEVVPVGKWSCAEWEFDGPNNSMHFWLDGKALADLTMSGTGQGCVHQDASFEWLAPTFSRIDLGWESYQADDARTMWIDDVALGTERLHCPP